MIASTSCLRDELGHEILVADIADDQLAVVRHRPAEAGRQIVEDDDLLARVESSSTIWLPI